MNATTSGKKEMQEAVKEAKEALGMFQKKRFCSSMRSGGLTKPNKIFVPFVEDGTIILIGATTENPYFEVNQALISRSNVFELKSLEAEDIKKAAGQSRDRRREGHGDLSGQGYG